MLLCVRTGSAYRRTGYRPRCVPGRSGAAARRTTTPVAAGTATGRDPRGAPPAPYRLPYAARRLSATIARQVAADSTAPASIRVGMANVPESRDSTYGVNMPR